MKEQKNIIAEFNKIDFSTHKAALATVVKVRGSSYRSPGARMLIRDDGKWVGSISGGCLEGDALRKARKVMADNEPITITYDTREESNQNLGIGLGCNGVIDVLMEPIDPEAGHNPIDIFRTLISIDEPVALATIFSSGSLTGKKMLMKADGELLLSFPDKDLESLIMPDLLRFFDSKRSEAKLYNYNGSEIELFIEIIQPTISLMIFGGGFDARPVSELAKSIGWNVTVTDECVAHIAPVFFPNADHLSLCHREFIDRDFDIGLYTACVLMSHNYEYDRDVLKKLLKTRTPYIGILGPRKRFEKMLIEFERHGALLSGADFERIHSPIGLDIGAETPDEIALSIITEIQSKFSNRSGGFLKYRNAPIHHRDQKSDQVFKEVYIAPHLKNKSANEG
jgi:xanthine dehydrogenase accessory factor